MRYFLREFSISPKRCDTPPWYLILHRHIYAIPHFATYRAIIVRYPTKTSTKYFCDTIATSIARYEKYRYWASKPPRIFSLCRTLKIPGTERKNSQINKEIPCNGKSKDIQKSKERKISLRTKSLLMVVSKWWFEFSGGTRFRYPLFTSI